MELDMIKRGLREEIKKREKETYATCQTNVRDMCTDVLSKLEEQEKEIAELKESQRWRKFSEETPEWGVDVLVIDKDCDIHIVRFSHDFKWISWGKMNTCESDCITHWMPLPKFPEDK